MNTGDIWNGWTIDSFIGEGTFGKVYKIVRNEYGHMFESALKIIRVPRDSAELASLKSSGMSDANIRTYYQGMVKEIAKEVALLSELKGNSHIVSYEDHEIVKLEDDIGWKIYIRMELVTPLYRYVEEHPLSEKDVIRLGSDICKALEACRQFKIIHRDIKPENIFVSDQGQFKLGDFGIAKQLDVSSVAMSKQGAPAYMAPEVYREESYDMTADIYSLGLVLYKFLNEGRTPFLPPATEQIRFSDKEEALVKRMTGESLPPPCTASEAVSKIVLKACAYNPADRYKNASEMRKALESICPEEFDSDEDKKRKWVKAITVFLTVVALAAGAFAYIQVSKVTVPDVIGKTEDDAKAMIESAELVYDEKREFSDEIRQGVVMDESSVGEKVRKGTEIEVIVSSGKGIGTPGLEGKSVKTAEVILDRYDLDIEVVSEEYSDDIAGGSIISQEPKPGEKAEKGQAIKVVKSKGREQVTVPDVIGMTPSEAEKMLEDAGLRMKVNQVNSDATPGQIVEQSLEGGSTAFHGIYITVNVSVGTVTIEGKDD